MLPAQSFGLRKTVISGQRQLETMYDYGCVNDNCEVVSELMVIKLGKDIIMMCIEEIVIWKC